MRRKGLFTLLGTLLVGLPFIGTSKNNSFSNASAISSGYTAISSEVVSFDFDSTNGVIWAATSENDYTSSYMSLFNQVASDATNGVINTLNKITLDDVPLSTYCTRVVLNKYVRPYLAFELSSQGKALNPTSIHIPSGTEFPSYAANFQSNKICYVTSSDVTLTKAGENYGALYLDVEDVEVASFSEQNLTETNSILNVTLSNSDYASYSDAYHLWRNDANANRLKILNVCNDITFNDKVLTLPQGNRLDSSAEPMVKLGGDPNRFSFRKAGNESISTVTFSKGTMFPSVGYSDGLNAKIYRIKEEVTFVKSSSGYSKVANDIPNVITNVDTVISYQNDCQVLRIFFKTSDYAEAVNDERVNDNIKTTYTNYCSNIKLNGKNVDLTAKSHYLKYKGASNSIAFKLTSEEFDNLESIYIPKGTTFPTYAMVKGDSVNKAYIMTESVNFIYGSGKFTKGSDKLPIENEIVELSSSGDGADKSVDFHLKIWDWPNRSVLPNYVLNSTSALPNFNDVYNTHNRIHAYDTNGVEIEFTQESFINVWGGDLTFAMRIRNPDINMPYLAGILIEEGCEFPTYKGFEGTNKGSSVFDDTVYVVSKEYYFNYVDGIFVLGSKYDETPTSITAVKEQNYDEPNSFLRLELSAHDYTGVSTNTNTNIYQDKLDDLNFSESILINGVSLKDDPNYLVGEKFINLFGLTGSFAFRTTGNNTGCYYIRNSLRYETNDKTVYEIAFKKGCQIPSYEYLSGRTNKLKCFVLERDYVFVYFDGEYHLADNFEYPDYQNVSINKVDFRDIGSEKAIDFNLSTFDWPTSPSISNKDIRLEVPCFNLNSHILLVDRDNIEHLITSVERFINVWGAGNLNPTFSLRNPISYDQVKYIRIYQGAEFPSYSAYQGLDNVRYRLNKTTSYYASLDNCYYRGSDLTASSFAYKFNEAMGEVCALYDGHNSSKAGLINKFYAFKNIYNLELTSDVKDELKNSSDQVVTSMLERYDYVVEKYQLDNFLNRTISSSKFLNKTPVNLEILLLSLSIVAVVLGFGIYTYKRRGQ